MPNKQETSNVVHVGAKLKQSRALGKSVSESMAGLTQEKSLLLEENLSVLALRWLDYQQDEDINVAIKGSREFFALTKLLLELAERRQKHNEQKTSAISSDGLSVQQVRAFREALLGE